MNSCKLCVSLVFLLLTSSRGEDTVAEDIGVHQLERLVEMLTVKECEDLLSALSHPEENIFQRLEHRTAEKSQQDLKPRTKRDTASTEDAEAQCRAALTDWLLRYGERIYYDRLSRALQHIGRTDIAIEVGKNINQDKMLNLKRHVEDYHKYVQSLNTPLVKSNTEDNQHTRRRIRKRKVRDLTWRDLDLIVERGPVPLYQKGPLDVAVPLLYGLLVGFGGSLLAAVFLFLIIVRFSPGRYQDSHPMQAARSQTRHLSSRTN